MYVFVKMDVIRRAHYRRQTLSKSFSYIKKVVESNIFYNNPNAIETKELYCFYIFVCRLQICMILIIKNINKQQKLSTLHRLLNKYIHIHNLDR